MKQIQKITYDQITAMSRRNASKEYDFLEVIGKFTEMDEIFNKRDEVVY